MFSEYLLSDNFEKDDGGYAGHGGGSGAGCLVLLAVMGSVLSIGLCTLVLVLM
jgi:hypothetical protein